MSGTSLDGLDICYAHFRLEDHKWSHKIIYTSTCNFPDQLYEKLRVAMNLNAQELMLLNNELGNFIGDSINAFITKNNISHNEIDFVSSHGHTVFHQPHLNLTTQIGAGANISSATKLPVICDFRSTDVALKGQGAPLVPIGDQHLFSQYDFCINLGGIANISYNHNSERLAYDICAVNIVLNYLSNEMDLAYDKDGAKARTGEVDATLLQKLNELEYYQKEPPKSLGLEWVQTNVFPLLEKDIPVQDKLRTYTEHIACQLADIISSKNKKALFTGGGTLNTFLMERVKALSVCSVVIPEKNIINFKEALIFAFLGVLRKRKEKNSLKSVTGAKSDTIGGCIYQAF